MGTFVRLALRNVARNKSRAAFTLGSIAFGVMMTLLLGSFVIGLGNAMVDDTIRGKVGALQVHRKGYDDLRDNQPLDLDMEQGGELEKKILATPGVSGVSPRLVFSGMATNGTTATMFLAVAFDPAREYSVLPLATFGLEGKPISADLPSGVLFGKELADAMDLGPGGSAILQAASKTGQQNAMDVEVAGTLNNGTPFENKRVIQVPLAWAQELLGMQGRVTELAVAVPDRERIDEVARDLQQRLGPDYHVQTWRQLRSNLEDVVKVQRLILGAVGFVFLVIAIIGVINTMLMSVLERTREIGTMMAVGLRRGRITWLFLLEGLALAVLGGGSGTALALGIIAAVLGAGGIPLTVPGSTALVYIQPAVPLDLVLPTVLAAGLGTLAAAAYPSWRAARLRPVEALRAV